MSAEPERHSPLPERPAQAAPVTLPAVPEIRRWIERTRHERAGLQDRANRLREQFEPLRSQLAGIERSIKVLDHFLGQVTVEGGDSTNGSAPSLWAIGRRLEPGQWSRQHASCRGCGTTERRHKANGYCTRCESRVRQQSIVAPRLDAQESP